MLQCRVLVASLLGVAKGPAQRRLKLSGKPGSCIAVGGWRRRGSFLARIRRLIADRGGERVPIGHAEQLGDQFQALTDGDIETLGSKRGTKGVRHSFSVAEVAHISIPCLNETGVPGACVTD